ncbi:MAG: bifunctional demethylmenaquinone methyltransferase/2-methoxy-6-polyprenyl-1,4-benzoquinol methylase UbiE [Marinilabiliales bacterium]|nr:MAG: bifunctional demethylmenaquinone methyltransferase/2-methoxy-6-polyprenyl-1,4-benzoquinol methylase UbiE [Marinilabiliales bacterium]
MEQENKGKKVKVEKMFNDIAHKYDFLNHFLSLGIDIIWRRKVRKTLSHSKPKKILDVATGTADLAIELCRLNPDEIIGVDIAEEMLNIGKEKIIKKKLDKIIKLEIGDSEKLRFQDNTFDAVTVSFGVRNYEDLQAGLKEMNRVLKPGGTLAVLEFSKPSKFPLKQLYNFYFKYILPLFGKVVSSHDSAYTYLPESVQAFAEGEEFLMELKKANYKQTKQNRLSFGIATLYTAKA